MSDSARHEYWRRKAIRARHKEEAERRATLRVASKFELHAAAMRRWLVTSFPWCDRCLEYTVRVGGECAWPHESE